MVYGTTRWSDAKRTSRRARTIIWSKLPGAISRGNWAGLTRMHDGGRSESTEAANKEAPGSSAGAEASNRPPGRNK